MALDINIFLLDHSAMTPTQPKRGPGRPRTKNPIQAPSTTDLGFDDNPDRPTVNLKDKLTEKELRFLEIYMSGRYTIDKAMIAAGYTGYNLKYLYRLSRKIVEKYESQADDHRKIFRAMGAGELAVVEGLLKLARTAKSEMVKLNAWSMIAKCLGLTKEIIEGAGGVTIIFEGSDQAQEQALPGAPPLPPSQGEIKVLPTSTKPMMITK